MRKLFFLPAIFLLKSFAFRSNEPTAKEREYAISYFKETKENLSKAISGLSEKQLNWKANDSVWSIANCVEHITISEKSIFDWAMSTLQEKADPSKRSQLGFDDDGIKKLITDRSNKVKTNESLKPSGQFGNAEETLKVFYERREQLINFMKSTKDDLRNHFAEFPFGLLDTYQLLIFIGGHTQRHILQIIEVKSNPGFPKS